LRRINLPEPVTLTRLAMAVCVFSFCFITFFLDGVLQPQNQSITDAPSEAQRSLSPERTPYHLPKEYTIVARLPQGGYLIPTIASPTLVGGFTDVLEARLCAMMSVETLVIKAVSLDARTTSICLNLFHFVSHL
jgi:hypothetical protein